MRHPTDGTLRRLVDEPAGVADSDRRHVADCPICLSGLAAAREDAAAVGTALVVDGSVHASVDGRAAEGADRGADVERAWRRLSRSVGVEEQHTAPVPSRARRRRGLRSPVVAAVGVAVLLAGAGAAAAADWLPIFHTERIAPVAVTRADLVQLPDLSAYGKAQVTQEPHVRRVADAAAAEKATGLSVPQVTDLPDGVTGSPMIQVGGQASAVFTFSADKAARAASAAGEALPTPPPGLDGSRFRLTAGPGVAMVWSSAQGLPALAVGRAVAPKAYSSGVPFETARDYLLSLPGLPDELASQLRSFTGDGTTLPLPIPAGEVSTSTTDVDGVPATVLTARDGTLAGVVWVRDGVVTAVAGSLSTDEVLSVARGLQEAQ